MIKISNVVPRKYNVVVRLLNLDEIYESLITQTASTEDRIAIRYGEVVSKGPDADKPGHCYGLKVGDIVIFTEFAGYYIPTNNDVYKVIKGYDIIGKIKDVKMVETLKPTGNRVLVEVFTEEDMLDGIILNNAKDPRLADLDYGKIVRIGDEANKLNLQTENLVAFPPYVGTTIRDYESSDKKQLKIIVEEDILFTA
jgi:co-chaperonin GroES (HSP10)